MNGGDYRSTVSQAALSTSATDTLSLAPGRLETFTVTITLPLESTYDVNFDVETPKHDTGSANETLINIIDVVPVYTGANIACLFLTFGATKEFYSAEENSNKDHLLVKFGMVQNTGLAAMQDSYLAGDNDVKVDITVQATDNLINMDAVAGRLQFGVSIEAGVVHVSITFGHTKQSRAEIIDPFLTVLLPKYITTPVFGACNSTVTPIATTESYGLKISYSGYRMLFQDVFSCDVSVTYERSLMAYVGILNGVVYARMGGSSFPYRSHFTKIEEAGWSPGVRSGDFHPWIQIDFGRELLVSGFTVTDNGASKPLTIDMKFGYDLKAWADALMTAQSVTFTGNSVTIPLPQKTPARYVRIVLQYDFSAGQTNPVVTVSAIGCEAEPVNTDTGCTAAFSADAMRNSPGVLLLLASSGPRHFRL
ncbi:PREDICTED: uncharacterized protein LOC106807645 [Priapulus caudatus]|uniref:Uncharacterized protein LOC106807645 n=1 Tax=Priapulus caudatus TaxID=37621 RepID=A0ABM1E021_PRICU|nr:PREDICTED: uncharacterized protein LOC106807645 [Priapulus caudatus]